MLPRIAMVSTFPPTRCGIATFAQSLTGALIQAGASVDVIDLPTDEEARIHDGVLHRHRGRQDLATTSALLNSFDVVILQHEFGIWDGDDGHGIIDLIGALAVPVISVLHTVPAAAQGGQRRVLQQLLDLSDALVTLSHSAYRRLVGDYATRTDTIEMIPHGALARWPLRRDDEVPPGGRFLTWGLIGRGKGLEWGIQALAQLHLRGMQAEYVIAGATHPNVQRAEGEAYRRSLRELATALGVGRYVTIVDGYLTPSALTDLMSTSTAFLLPYDSREQVTSGVLVEAIAAGGPVVATRFPHAVEMLSTGTGLLVDHQDSTAMADALERILTEEDSRKLMRTRSRGRASDLGWDSVGADYLALSERLWRGQHVGATVTSSPLGVSA